MKELMKSIGLIKLYANLSEITKIKSIKLLIKMIFFQFHKKLRKHTQFVFTF